MWLGVLMGYANRTKIGIVSNLLPILGNLSVAENILVGAYYHHSISYKEGGMKLVEADLKKYGLEVHIDSRSNQLNDFEKLIVKYLQVKYLCLSGLPLSVRGGCMLRNTKSSFMIFYVVKSLQNRLSLNTSQIEDFSVT